MKRRLPDDRETAEILATRRTRPAYAAAPPAARAVARLITPFDQKFGGGPQALKSRWKEIVGETLARFTEPVKVSKPRGGGPASLELKVSGPAAALIQHQAPEILQRVNLFLGEGAVDRLRIIQGPITTASPKTRHRRAAPLDAAAEARLRASLNSAPDSPLKEALLHLGRGVLRAELEGRVRSPRAKSPLG